MLFRSSSASSSTPFALTDLAAPRFQNRPSEDDQSPASTFASKRALMCVQTWSSHDVHTGRTDEVSPEMAP